MPAALRWQYFMTAVYPFTLLGDFGDDPSEDHSKFCTLARGLEIDGRLDWKFNRKSKQCKIEAVASFAE